MTWRCVKYGYIDMTPCGFKVRCFLTHLQSSLLKNGENTFDTNPCEIVLDWHDLCQVWHDPHGFWSPNSMIHVRRYVMKTQFFSIPLQKFWKSASGPFHHSKSPPTSKTTWNEIKIWEWNVPKFITKTSKMHGLLLKCNVKECTQHVRKVHKIHLLSTN